MYSPPRWQPCMTAVHGMMMTYQPGIASDPTKTHQPIKSHSSPVFSPAGQLTLLTLPLVALVLLQEWWSENEFWLVPYAAFCFLRDLFGTAEHWKWGVMARPTPQVPCDQLDCAAINSAAPAALMIASCPSHCLSLLYVPVHAKGHVHALHITLDYCRAHAL